MIFLFFLFQTIPLFFDSFYQEDLKYITFFVEESDCAYKKQQFNPKENFSLLFL